MFDTPGKKLKEYASFLFGIIAILIIILAISTALLLSYIGGIIWVCCLVVAALLIFVAYICSLFIYAFGELVDNSNKINSIEKKMNDLSLSSTSVRPGDNYNKSKASVSTANNTSEPTPKEDKIDKNEKANEYKREPLIEHKVESQEWICPKCGKKRAHYYDSCTCGYIKSK